MDKMKSRISARNCDLNPGDLIQYEKYNCDDEEDDLKPWNQILVAQINNDGSTNYDLSFSVGAIFLITKSSSSIAVNSIRYLSAYEALAYVNDSVLLVRILLATIENYKCYTFNIIDYNG